MFQKLEILEQSQLWRSIANSYHSRRTCSTRKRNGLSLEQHSYLRKLHFCCSFSLPLAPFLGILYLLFLNAQGLFPYGRKQILIYSDECNPTYQDTQGQGEENHNSPRDSLFAHPMSMKDFSTKENHMGSSAGCKRTWIFLLDFSSLKIKILSWRARGSVGTSVELNFAFT